MQRWLNITVFFAGLTSLAIEMSASRLLGNYFGSSNLVWACIIGLILIYLTVGYYLGGFLADRNPFPERFYTIICWAAVTTGLIPLIGRPVLRIASGAFDRLEIGLLAGTFTAVLILFIAPITLLGTISPYAVKLSLRDPSTLGKTSGRLYAISTLGSFLGTFLPVLVLIPLIGTFRTFVVLGFILLSVGFAGIILTCGWKKGFSYSWMFLVLLAVFFFGFQGTEKEAEGLIYETESAYNYIQVLKQDDFTMLRLNEGQGIHSIYHPDQIDFQGPWEQMLIAPFFNSPAVDPTSIRSMAIIGLAAGTTARQASFVYPGIAVDGFEIDGKIVDVGIKYFDLHRSNLNVIIEDGRWGLNHSSKAYQIISVDAFRPPYIPWHLTTREFFRSIHQHLTEDGSMAINVGRAPGDRRLVDALYMTIQSEFASVYVMDIPKTYNSIIFATVKKTSAKNLESNYYALLDYRKPKDTVLINTIHAANKNLQPAPQQGIVFTDDRAPIEWITNDMILQFLISGELNKIQ